MWSNMLYELGFDVEEGKRSKLDEHVALASEREHLRIEQPLIENQLLSSSVADIT